MTKTIIKYVKNCHICKKIKHYRKNKQKLFKSLSIFERYFQNISIDFIISLFKCMRNDKIYKHIMIIMNRFNKKNCDVILIECRNDDSNFYRMSMKKKVFLNHNIEQKNSIHNSFLTSFMQKN